MMTTEKSYAAQTNDAELVAESLAGGRDAFRQIVERHQTLVCSLAYCATGSLTQSEDLAQETFISAWKQLAELREPSKLRPWLCGIARFVIGKELRRQGREPVHAAETLETVDELAASDPLPSERVISKEEQAILWHCVARIPEIYREPLVLFYREQQSIERVAEALELSEDAVKQRLARGRKLLQEQTLAYVEGALQNTNPSHAFTVGVLAALPLSATSAKAVTAGAAVKGSSTGKSVIALATLGTILLFYSLLAFLAFLGGCAGYGMSRACAMASKQCENATRFWRTVAAAFAACVFIPPLLFWSGLEALMRHLKWWGYGLFDMKFRLDVFCSLVVVALALWMRRCWHDFSRPQEVQQELGRRLKRRFTLWLSLGMVGPACLFGLVLLVMWCPTAGPVVKQHLSDIEFHAEVRKNNHERKYAGFLGTRDKDGSWTLEMYPRGIRGRLAFWGVANDSKLNESELIAGDENRVARPAIAANIYSREAWPLGWMLPFFLAPMGAVILLRQIGKRQWKAAAPGIAETLEQDYSKYGRMLLELRSDRMARRVFGDAFAAAFLLVFSANAFTAKGLYVVLFVGSVKGAFLGLVAGIGVLYLRTLRKVSKASVKF
jgi:RNA polymerase sigma factor (sigma-70 family)